MRRLLDGNISSHPCVHVNCWGPRLVFLHILRKKRWFSICSHRQVDEYHSLPLNGSQILALHKAGVFLLSNPRCFLTYSVNSFKCTKSTFTEFTNESVGLQIPAKCCNDHNQTSKGSSYAFIGIKGKNCTCHGKYLFIDMGFQTKAQLMEEKSVCLRQL